MIASRPPAVAGFFYPDEPEELAAEVDRHLAAARDHGLTPKAVIAPHAGYRYSAPVAASAYAGLRRFAGTVRRVVVLGPAHRVRLQGLALPSVGAFETPLGHVPIDADGRDALARLPHVTVDDTPHEPEHSLEVHVPFLQRVLGADGWSLLPFAVGSANADDVADVIERCWGGPDTLVVISSDLSHYLDYDAARSLDADTTRAIEGKRIEDLRTDSACGVRPVMGMLLVARRRGMRVVTLDVRNSGDTQGGRDRVVGYGAWAVVEDPHPTPSAEDGRWLLEAARTAVAAAADGGGPPDAALDAPPRVRVPQAAFVTLKIDGRLRGCVGRAEAVRPLAEAVARAAADAASVDPRFPPVTADDLPAVAVSVSVLSPLERVPCTDERDLVAALRPGVDGALIAERSGARGVFLPQVWEQVTDGSQFVARLKEKAGLPSTYWSETLAAYRFTVQHFGPT